MDTHDLALGEEASTRLRVNCILDALGPRLFEQAPDPSARAALAEGMRFEAAVHAAVSGALAIQGIAPVDVHESVGTGIQDSATNTVDGAYDLLEAEYREIRGMPRHFTIPTSPSAPAAAHDVPAFVRSAGAGDVDLMQWWELDDADVLQCETAWNGIAVHLYLTTEHFGQAPPVRSHGRDGEAFLLAPDVVNTCEHMMAQLTQLRRALETQRDLLGSAVFRSEKALLALYERLYRDAPEAAADLLLVRPFLASQDETDGEET